jgi:hypothetical protein
MADFRYTDHLDGDRQVTYEELITAMIFGTEEELSEDVASDLGRRILRLVLSEFRPDLAQTVCEECGNLIEEHLDQVGSCLHAACTVDEVREHGCQPLARFWHTDHLIRSMGVVTQPVNGTGEEDFQ